MIQGEKYLVNTDDLYTMPDGGKYNAFWGSCEFIPVDQMQGIKPTTRETNWYLKMNNVFIAGCAIHCWVQTNKPPAQILSMKWEKELNDYTKQMNIYYTDDIPDSL